MAANSQGNNSTATATATPSASIAPSPPATPTATPAASATATPVPTPAPRQVFSSARWDTDHVTVQVTNNGAPVSIVAWIDSPSKKATVAVGAGETILVSTPTIQAQNGQILKYGFEAYENDTLIDTNSATITVNLAATPTPLPPETVTVSGTIVDSSSGAPVPGAKVTFMPEGIDKTYGPVTADNDGFFSSPKMYAGVRYTIKISATGYQAIGSITDDKISADSSYSIPITKLASGATPTPTTAPSPTPSSPLDAWTSLLYNPITCLGSITALVTAIGGSIGIYEWMEKRKNLRLQGKNEPPGAKKP